MGLEEWESSYRQFGERRALGEGSSHRCFGGGFAEPAACEGGLAKGSKVWKTTEKPSKKIPKRVQNGTLAATGSLPRATLKNVPIPGAKVSSFLGSFLDPGAVIWGTHFLMFFGYPPRTTFGRFWSPKGLQKGRLWRSIWGPFSKTRKV